MYKGPWHVWHFMKNQKLQGFEPKCKFPDVRVFLLRAMAHQRIKKLRNISLEQISTSPVCDYRTSVNTEKEKASVSLCVGVDLHEYCCLFIFLRKRSKSHVNHV